MKILRNILLGLTITLLSLIAITGLLTFIFQDKLKQFAINQVNAQIKVPIIVKAGIDVSFFKNFPNVSISLKEVTINDPIRKNQDLLKLNEVSLLVNISEVMSEKQSLRKIIFNKGQIYLLEDGYGKTNFDILKKTNENTSSSELQLKSVILKDVALVWHSIPSQTKFSATIDKAELHGDFGKTNFGLGLDANFNWNYFIYKQDTFSVFKKTALAFAFQIDKTTKTTDIKPSVLRIEKTEISVVGKLNNSNKAYNDLQITASCKGDKMASLLSLLPNSIQEKLSGAKGDGEYAIHFAINGKSGSGNTPQVKLNGYLKNGEIELKQLKKSITEVNTELNYDSKTDVFSIATFKANYDEKPIHFSLKVKDIKSAPEFDLTANGVLNLQAIQSFIPEQYVQNAEGEIDFKNFKLSGQLDENRKLIATSLKGGGKFTFKEAEVQANDVTYGNINGVLEYEHDHLDATNVTANFLTTDFLFNGKIDNLVPYIIEKIKRENNTSLVLDGSLSIKQFNLTNMLKAFKKEEDKKGSDKIDIREIFNMEGKLNLSVTKFQYNKIIVEDITVDVGLSPGSLMLKSFDARGMGGTIHHSGLISFSDNREMIMNGTLNFSGVEIPQIFDQTENFGQTTLTSKNIKGEIKADVDYRVVFDDYKNINMDKINATLNCSILKGELINFEPIKVASKFIRVEELNHIYFSDLKNQLLIKNSTIEIPKFEIQSSAINVMLNGSHSFDNDIDYHIKVNLRKLLANKFKKNNTNEYIEEDPYEGTNLFLSLKGNMSNPTVKYDRQYADQKISDDFKKEKENLKTLFKKETVKTETKDKTKEDKYFDTREKPKFIELEEEN